jgi:hypothetical protein
LIALLGDKLEKSGGGDTEDNERWLQLTGLELVTSDRDGSSAWVRLRAWQ